MENIYSHLASRMIIRLRFPYIGKNYRPDEALQFYRIRANVHNYRHSYVKRLLNNFYLSPPV